MLWHDWRKKALGREPHWYDWALFANPVALPGVLISELLDKMDRKTRE